MCLRQQLVALTGELQKPWKNISQLSGIEPFEKKWFKEEEVIIKDKAIRAPKQFVYIDLTMPLVHEIYNSTASMTNKVKHCSSHLKKKPNLFSSLKGHLTGCQPSYLIINLSSSHARLSLSLSLLLNSTTS